MIRSLITIFINFIIPPRASERVVSRLTLEDLLNLQTEDGLPYHDSAVRALVWELKYYANAHASSLAGELLAEELLAVASEEIGTPLLVPIPMHPTRRKERGHNQTEVLCEAALRALGKNSGVFDYVPNALIRITNTSPQQGLARHKRLKNLTGSMTASEIVKGRVCVVVDDVSTTGATFAEAKRALKKAGARSVHTIALARS
jgi:ComF family protein